MFKKITLNFTRGVYKVSSEICVYDAIKRTTVYNHVSVLNPVTKKQTFVDYNSVSAKTIDIASIKVITINVITKLFGKLTNKDFKEIEKIS